MNTVRLVELSSGFGNVPNGVIFADDYYGHPAAARPGSAYDKEHVCELPEGFAVGENQFGKHYIYDQDGIAYQIGFYGKRIAIWKQDSFEPVFLRKRRAKKS